jgi:hypothetical protein
MGQGGLHVALSAHPPSDPGDRRRAVARSPARHGSSSPGRRCYSPSPRMESKGPFGPSETDERPDTPTGDPSVVGRSLAGCPILDPRRGSPARIHRSSWVPRPDFALAPSATGSPSVHGLSWRRCPGTSAQPGSGYGPDIADPSHRQPPGRTNTWPIPSRFTRTERRNPSRRPWRIDPKHRPASSPHRFCCHRRDIYSNISPKAPVIGLCFAGGMEKPRCRGYGCPCLTAWPTLGLLLRLTDGCQDK